MEKSEILSQVTEIFRDVLDNEEIVLADTTTANDIEEWDSLSHIQLIVAIEKDFKIKFTSAEILSWKNVGEMIDNISKKLA
ncbi:MAG: acyl carrier protein [Bacteroidales bacterium]|nr:acyl carrier protein [Bacteroidales bacterium]